MLLSDCCKKFGFLTYSRRLVVAFVDIFLQRIKGVTFTKVGKRWYECIRITFVPFPFTSTQFKKTRQLIYIDEHVYGI